MNQLLLYLIGAAFFQNFVLTTGFGITEVIRKSTHPKDRLWQAGYMLWFSLLTAFTIFALDSWIEGTESMRFWRPLLVVTATVWWYIVTVVVFRMLFPKRFVHHRRNMEWGAFNGIVVGVALMANYQLRVEAPALVGLCIGATASFFLLLYLQDEGERRMRGADMPEVFCGIPARFLYLGILALALYGFASPVTLI